MERPGRAPARSTRARSQHQAPRVPHRQRTPGSKSRGSRASGATRRPARRTDLACSWPRRAFPGTPPRQGGRGRDRGATGRNRRVGPPRSTREALSAPRADCRAAEEGACRQHHRQHRTERCTQECEPESPVPQTELLLDMRDMRNPGRKQHAVDEEHGRYRSAGLPRVSWVKGPRDSSPHCFRRAVRRRPRVAGPQETVRRLRRQ